MRTWITHVFVIRHFGENDGKTYYPRFLWDMDQGRASLPGRSTRQIGHDVRCHVIWQTHDHGSDFQSVLIGRMGGAAIILLLPPNMEDKMAAEGSELKNTQRRKAHVDLDDPSNVYDENKFDFRAVKVLLTYPQSKLTRDVLLQRIKDTVQVTRFCIGQERHADGGTHFHCYLHFAKELHTRNTRYFDFEGEHPNWRRIGDVQGAVEYCMKDGDYIMDGIDFYKNSKGFKRKKADQDAWIRHVQQKGLQEIKWPFRLPTGQEVHYPVKDAEGKWPKKRHWWIVSDPNKGKTFWVNEVFAGQKVFMRSCGKYPYEEYEDEELVICDDVFPKFEEIADVCNIWHVRKHVYGDVRYVTKAWKLGQVRTMIVLSNSEPSYGPLQQAFDSRFTVVRWDLPDVHGPGFERVE